MAAKNQHVIPHAEGWAVREEGSRRVAQVFASKREAIDRAIEIARELGSKMHVQGSSGQIFLRPDIDPAREDEIRRVVREVMDLQEPVLASRVTPRRRTSIDPSPETSGPKRKRRRPTKPEGR